MKRKDALTDLIEYTQAAELESSPASLETDQVIGIDGEIITLGEKPSLKPKKGIPLELSEGLTSALHSAFGKALDRISGESKQNKAE
jgi:hypothetical protein